MNTKGGKDRTTCWKHAGRTGTGSELQKVAETFQSFAPQISIAISLPNATNTEQNVSFYKPNVHMFDLSKHWRQQTRQGLSDVTAFYSEKEVRISVH